MQSGNIRPFKIGIAGAAGVWADRCHAPAINELFTTRFPIRVVAIAELGDPLSSATARGHTQAQQMIEMHNPTFIDASSGAQKTLSHLDDIHARENLDLLIVCTDPVAHFPYCSWAARNAISFLCDKPIALADNCSSQLVAAAALSKQFDRLLRLIRAARAQNTRFRAATILRRRSLAPFVLAAQEIASVYRKSEAPVRSMNVAASVGVHFTSDEYLSPGAHGFLDGCGSLSFSSYHYLDVIAWFLSLAPGKTSHLRIESPYTFRVADCLATNVSAPLFRLLAGEKDNTTRRLPDHVAATELDFLLTMHLLDCEERPCGLITYTYNRTSYTARRIKPSPHIFNPGAHPDGGRMSQVLIDLHQGPCQSIRILKNDAAFGSQRIRYERWVHPILNPDGTYEERIFEDAYESNATTPKRLVQDFIRLVSGTVTEADVANLPSPIEAQEFTHNIYAACYEVLAEDAEARCEKRDYGGGCKHARTVKLG